MFGWVTNRHKHRYNLVATGVIDPARGYNTLSVSECECGKELWSRESRVIWLKCLPVPKHRCQVRPVFDGSEWPPPKTVMFCESSGRAYRAKAERGGFWGIGDTGAWSFVYYAPCCAKALLEVEPDTSKWCRQVARAD